MSVQSATTSIQVKTNVVWTVLIILAATAAGMIVEWRAPSLSLYSQDWLMRQRGSLAEPDDIVIVAIDEASISKLGQFPWKRGLTAKVVETLAAAHPKAIALDILYSEPT